MAGTRLQSLVKLIAAMLFVAIVSALGVYISHLRKRILENEKPGLRPKVTQLLSNVRYSHEVGGVVRFVLTAGVDRAYEDGSHELEQVKLESHGTDGSRDDTVTADKAKVSNTADTDNLTAEFTSNVNVVTTEGLILKTNSLKYDAAKNTIETADPVEFKRDNLHGKCVGLLLEAGPERAHLLHQVDATLEPESPKKDGDSKEPGKANGDKNAKSQNGSVAANEGQKQETPEEIAA
ncbi:MAG TPA: LPS export ABC transporter periplasmic protein LptC, partial [Blastocatellia bacterium]|nr:LPS export ABC transporter periplasmic protein LptC [Blastocatellia bacterium]